MLVKGSVEDVSVLVIHEALGVCWHKKYIFISHTHIHKGTTNKDFQAYKKEHFSITCCDVYAQGFNTYVCVYDRCADDKKCFQFLPIFSLPLGLVIEENTFPEIYYKKYSKIVVLITGI